MLEESCIQSVPFPGLSGAAVKLVVSKFDPRYIESGENIF